MTLMEAVGDSEIASDHTESPVGTISAWRHGRGRDTTAGASAPAWRPPDPAAYAYLLGALPGRRLHRRSRRARLGSMIALDARYPGIVDSAQAAIERVFPDIRVHRYRAEDE